MKRRIAAAAAAALVAAPSARAEQLSLERNVEWRAESSDNVGLVPVPAGSTNRLAWLGGLTAARESERAATRLEAGLHLRVGDQGEGRSADVRLALLQTLALPRDNASVGVNYGDEQSFADAPDANDLALGRNQRRTAGASAAWSHQFDERWSGQFDGSLSRATYDGGGADYSNRSLSLGVDRRWDETRRFGLRLSRSDYAQPGADSRSSSDNLRLTASQSLDERSSLSLALGAYRTLSRRPLLTLACPLAQALCDAGLVAPIVVHSEGRTRGSGAQYSLGYDASLDERTQVKLNAARELSPSGLGVQRADTLGATLSTAFTPTWRGGAAWTEARNRAAAAADAPRPRLRTLEFTTSWQCSERWTLSAGATLRRYTEPRGDIRAASTGISIALQYAAPKLVASR